MQLGLSDIGTLNDYATGRLDNARLREQVVDTDDFAPATPHHELRRITALQFQGHLVGMLGDCLMALAARSGIERLITRVLGMRIFFDMAFTVAASFAIFRWKRQGESAFEVARTGGVDTIVFCELFYLSNVRYFTTHAFNTQTLRGNPTVMKVVRV